MSDKEIFYDQHIAPKLAELAKECEARGMPFLALVEWEPGEGGRTCVLPPGASFGIRMAETAARARGNVDSLILALMRYAGQHGHSSVCLSRLGVAHAPPEASNSANQPPSAAPTMVEPT